MARKVKSPIAAELRDLRRWADQEAAEIRRDQEAYQRNLRRELNRLALQIGAELPSQR